MLLFEDNVLVLKKDNILGPGDRGTRVPGRYKGPGDRVSRVPGSKKTKKHPTTSKLQQMEVENMHACNYHVYKFPNFIFSPPFRVGLF